MKNILLLIAILIINFSFGQFQKNVIVDNSLTLANAKRSITADIDGDNDLDIVTVSSSNKGLNWFENLDGQGTFSLIKNIDTIILSSSVIANDIDGDSDLDLIISNNNGIFWYENIDGFGNFSTVKTISDSVISTYVVASDMDNDNDLDIVYCGDYNVGWFENNNGVFGSEHSITTNLKHPRSVSVADIDNDGNNDVITASYGNGSGDEVVWYRNLGVSGNFTSKIVIDSNVRNVTSVKVADIDGDGDNDVVYDAHFSNKLIWQENTNSLGAFGGQQIISTTLNSVVDIFVTDIDNDDDIDVVVSSLFDYKIAWYENTDSFGVFGSENIISNSSEQSSYIFAGDIDSDGFVDVLVTSTADSKTAWYKNNNGVNFGNQQLINKTAESVRSIHSSDIDGDGDLDIISASIYDNKIAWYENDGTENQQQHIVYSGTGGPASVYSIDIDGDGDFDIVSALAVIRTGSIDQIVWFENLDGLGNFSSKIVISENIDNPNQVLAIDLDGDGDNDILSASGDRVAWYRNTNNTFIQHTINFAGGNALHVVDIDNDNDLDILYSKNNKIIVHKMTSQGDFTNGYSVVNSVHGASSLHTSDVDTDGDMDIVFILNDKVGWLENLDGQGNFSDEIIVSNYANSQSQIFSTDIDGDGDSDLLTINSSRMDWYENTHGTFGDRILIGYSNIFRSIFPCDMDNDGDIDVISGTTSNKSVLWYENLRPERNIINGFVRLDYNLDGCDSADVNMKNLLVTSYNDSESFSTFTLDNGFYQLHPATGDFTTEITSSLPNYFSANPNFYNNNFVDVGNIDYSDFCLEPNQSVGDLTVSLLPISDARPGFNTTYQIVYKNVGTTQLTGNLTLEFEDTKLSFIDTSEAVFSQTSNLLTFDYSDLNIFETRTIDVTFNVSAPPIVNIDDVLHFTSTINPIASDYTADDNIFELNQTVVGSYDPNDITCLEGNQVLYVDKDKYLHYIIRFQNTGTASAINVVVKNTLDSHLDWSTLQLENLSHNNRVTIKNGNEIEFIFESINLSDSTTDEPNSHGFIAYKIKPKANIVLGDVITNKANIFFDFNEVIETNIATTTIVNVLATSENVLLDFSVYPIPTENSLNINSKSEISMIEIYNKLGQLIMKKPRENIIDISNLPHGLYFVKVKDVNGNSGIKKMIKK